VIAAIDRRTPAVFARALLAYHSVLPEPQCVAGMSSIWALDFDLFKVSTACQRLQKLGVGLSCVWTCCSVGSQPVIKGFLIRVEVKSAVSGTDDEGTTCALNLLN